jgi:hypothetical protein
MRPYRPIYTQAVRAFFLSTSVYNPIRSSPLLEAPSDYSGETAVAREDSNFSSTCDWGDPQFQTFKWSQADSAPLRLDPPRVRKLKLPHELHQYCFELQQSERLPNTDSWPGGEGLGRVRVLRRFRQIIEPVGVKLFCCRTPYVFVKVRCCRYDHDQSPFWNHDALDHDVFRRLAGKIGSCEQLAACKSMESWNTPGG